MLIRVSLIIFIIFSCTFTLRAERRESHRHGRHKEGSSNSASNEISQESQEGSGERPGRPYGHILASRHKKRRESEEEREPTRRKSFRAGSNARRRSHHGRGKSQARHRGWGRIKRKLHQCPKWKRWDESKCLWPGNGIPELPETCHMKNVTDKFPQQVVEYYKQKAVEAALTIQNVFKERGLTKSCGHCSRKVACRKRKHHSKKSHFCKPVEFAFVDDECDNGEACQISVVNGACPAPIHQEHFVKYNMLISKRRHHSGAFEFHGHRFGFELKGRKWNADVPRNSASGESHESSAEESSSSSSEKSSETSKESSASQESKEGNSASNSSESAEKSIDKKNKHRISFDIPLWHCIKNKGGDKCLCCCGTYFPDATSGNCVRVKHGNRYPPLDFENFGKY